MAPFLLIGLGNPGAEYAGNRHNIGFMALDVYLKGLSISEKNQYNAQFAKFKIEHGGRSEEVITLKPQTFMNLSGQSVQPVMDFYKIPPSNLIVVHDEVDLPFQGIKIQKNRGAGGHNGIKSISGLIGTQDYIRVRLGVGKPSHPEFSVADYVLGRFAPEEMQTIMPFLEKAGDAIEAIIFEGYEKAATKFN
ncbi:MAG: aminoacyl-tRNA hydrolase [Bdellovibrionota bacterium]